MAVHAPITGASFDAPRNDVNPPSLAERARNLQVSAEYISSLAAAVQLCMESYQSALRKMSPSLGSLTAELALAQSLLNLLDDQALGISSTCEAIEIQEMREGRS